jgi:hypothetical protein
MLLDECCASFAQTDAGFEWTNRLLAVIARQSLPVCFTLLKRIGAVHGKRRSLAKFRKPIHSDRRC